MKDLERAQWKTLAKLFSRGLGQDRVASDKIAIKLRFDLLNPIELERFQKFGELAASASVKYDSFTAQNTGMMPDNHIVEVIIPYSDNQIAAVQKVASFFEVRIIQQSDGEVHRRVTPADPEFALADLTGVPWNIVAKSPYNTQVLEAVLPEPPDDDTRRRQEFAIGYVARPHAKHEVPEWLAHQAHIEGTGPRRSLVPKDWVSSTGGLERIRDAGFRESTRRAVRKTFQKS